MSIKLLHHLLSLTFWVFALLIAGSTVFAIVMLVSGQPILTTWSVAGAPVTEFSLAGYTQTQAGVAMNRGTLSVESGEPAYVLLRIFDVLMRGALWLPAIWLLRKVVGHVREGLPFNRDSFQQLRLTGYLLMAIPAWQLLNSALTQFLLLGGDTGGEILLPFPLLQVFTTTGERLQVFPEFNLWFLVAGLITLVLARVFRDGFALQQDSDAII